MVPEGENTHVVMIWLRFIISVSVFNIIFVVVCVITFAAGRTGPHTSTTEEKLMVI
jgi:hypothetical protein